MSKSQKALAFARLANIKHGSNRYRTKKVDDLQQAIYSAEKLGEEAGLSRATIQFAKVVIAKAAPHIIKMVEDGMVRVQVAAEAVRAVSQATQAGWTRADVEREGRKVINSYPSKSPGVKPRASAPQEKPVVRPPDQRSASRLYDHPPAPPFKLPSAKETGMPVDCTLEELQAFHEEYGRTPLHHRTFTDMSRHKRVVESVTFAVSLPDERLADIDGLFERLEAMLAYVPDKTKSNGLEHDFAADARRMLARIEKHLPSAIARLTELETWLQARRLNLTTPQPVAQLTN